ALQFAYENRLQFLNRRFLEQVDERLQIAEMEKVTLFAGKGRRDPKLTGQAGPEAGHQHAIADFLQKLSSTASHRTVLSWGNGILKRWHPCPGPGGPDRPSSYRPRSDCIHFSRDSAGQMVEPLLRRTPDTI